MKDVKIVFVDLDGTLKDSSQKISIRNKKVFEKLMDKGVQIVFATGRSLPYTVSLSKQFSTSSYVISSNGAEIYNYGSQRKLYQSVLSKENLNKLSEIIKKYNLYFIANCFLNSYTNKDFGDPGKKHVSAIEEISEDISQLIVESYSLDSMKLFRRDIADMTGIKISNKSRNVNDSNKILFYDITCSDVSKGNAVKILCNHLGIKLEDAMAIGDSDNDIEMLQSVGVSVAVSNATESLKSVASITTNSNDEEGVAVILEKLYNEYIA